MNNIHPLSEEIISKIAAGEVIERPVYAVKELIENSVDSGATNIAVYIENSGLKRICVIDNGHGMTLEDIKECFKPHTTSKISLLEDLNAIKTLGFRGEALSSIAAISKIDIKSKTAQDIAGTNIVLADGKIEKISPVGMPIGTTIIVENLFASVPARKKFLKSSRTEFRHILDSVTRAAFSHPEISFSLYHNNRLVFSLPKTQQIIERIKLLLGPTIYESLFPIAYEDSYIKISGFLTKPHVASTTQRQFIFINKRQVNDRNIQQAVRDAYSTLLEPTAHPICFLFIEIPYELVDVNVHPRKEQVRFENTRLVFDAVYKATTECLTKNDLTFNNVNWQTEGIFTKSGRWKAGNTHSFAAKLLKEQQLPWSLQDNAPKPTEIMQINNLYLIVSTQNGIKIIDQHASHERILYEQLNDEFKKQKTQTKRFLLEKSIVFDLPFTQTETLLENIAEIEKLGFTIERLSGSGFVLQSVPEIFKDRNPVTLILEILDDLEQDKKPKEIDKTSSKMIAYLACRAAVKAGDNLTEEQGKDLVEQLEKTANNTTCPHGRPTKIEISLGKINSLFKRN